MPTLLRLTTFPISLKLLLVEQPRFMRKQGWEVHLCSADGSEREIVTKIEGCPYHTVSFTRTITPIQDLWCLWQLVQLMRQIQPDIVHTHTPKAGLLGMLAARICGVPIRIHTIAGLPFMTAKGMKRKLLIAMEKLTFLGAQHVWPNSKSILKFVQENKLCPAQKLAIISEGSTNGIDLQQFSPEQLDLTDLNKVKAEINYDSTLTYVLAVGRIVKDKGIPELVSAFLNIYEKNDQLRLVLVGPLEEERSEELLPEETLEAIRKQEAIMHINWSDKVAAYLKLADVLVHASHREGFPNVPLQAGAMKCPIVCSAIPGNIDIVENGQTGITFPVGDITALQSALQEALDKPKERLQMAENLREKVVASFDRKVMHQELLDRYKLLLSEKSK